MTPEEKFDLITRNLQEIVDEDRLKEILQERDLAVYWGTAPTGRIHTGYFLPMFKIRDLLNAGCKVVILLADIHAFLDNMKSTWEQVGYRTQYYETIIKEMLKTVGADISKLTFVKGSDYQLDKNMTMDLYKMSALASTRDTKRAGADVVKQIDTPKLSGLLYPILQALDEIYLDVDAQFGGVDQRKIFMFAREFLPQVGYTKQIHLMNPMLGGLTGDKMSASDDNSKIDVLDGAKTVKKKLNKAFCEEGNIEENFFLDFSRLVLFPFLKDNEEDFIIDRPEKFGGKITYTSYEELEQEFAQKKLHPLDLKLGVAAYINRLLDPVRNSCDNEDFQSLLEKAYAKQ
ncbi:MAG: tyrosine--tRNA ligase [Candidatus Woesearchaeota archaeon]